MEAIRLPARLDDVVRARELNAGIRDGSLELDWTEVQEVDGAAAVALVDGLVLAEVVDSLNPSTMTNEVAEVIDRAFRTAGVAEGADEEAGEADEPEVVPPPPVEIYGEEESAEDDVDAPAGSEGPPLEAPSAATLRDRLEEMIRRDLLGPEQGEHEELDADLVPHVKERYLVGVLAPQRLRVRPEEQDRLARETKGVGDEEKAEPESPASPTLFPSSIGLSFSIPVDTGTLLVSAHWGCYEKEDAEPLPGETKERKVWRRTPMGGEVTLSDLSEGSIGPVVIAEEQSEVVLRGIARRVEDHSLVVSLFLVNGQLEPKENKDEAWLFQPELAVEAPDGSAIFHRRPAFDLGTGDEAAEARELAMRYRDEVEFATGHGVAVHATPAAADPRRAHRVQTTVIPVRDVPQETPRSVEDDPNLEGLLLDMKELAELPRGQLGPRLRPLADAYEKWIRGQRARIGDPGARLAGYESSARRALESAERALSRIREGLALLETNPVAVDAFRFANRAMWLQRVHSVFAERRRRKEDITVEDVDVPGNRTWRMFQLAFVLLNLDSVTNLHHRDRTHPSQAIVDLLFFPTGGGKTEAYLGLAAYTMALRRLQGDVAGRCGEHGVVVLMRYTLRLLTLQQFQRAATLICAMETIRRDAEANGEAKWGREPFRIGLWVGMRTTPNTTVQSAEALKQEHGTGGKRHYSVGGSGTPVQLKHCPWCGTPLDSGRDFKVENYGSGRGRTLVHCGNFREACPFSKKVSPEEGIPVLVVDEEIYRRLPSLLIATVDKFAQMPWKGEVEMLFGRVNGRCPRHGFTSPEVEDAGSHPKRGWLPAVKREEHPLLRPPDLVIQDELHLISGPLGTLTGLYETAVDELSTWDVGGARVRPKVIASTATIRRAKQQVHALFCRKVEVFPPPGLDASDNFFSVQRPPEERPGRRYLGICAQGRRLKSAVIHLYVAALCGAQQLYEENGRAADPWMTIVGYFNSIRELAGTRRLVEDDIQSRARQKDIVKRGLARRHVNVYGIQELTSRLSATDIPDVLDQMEVPWDPEFEERRKAAAKERRFIGRRPLDVLLATNMISVGVDVQRLGLMVVAGQPKTTAEYIQATSRVGRREPGLVITLYNWARPRDLSHYETFEQYHASFYQHVEALSVTPFAPRAVDRGLTALLVSLIRLSGEEMNPEEAAAKLDPEDPLVRRVIESIVRRATLVEGQLSPATDVKQMLEERVAEWLRRLRRGPGHGRLVYARGGGDVEPLLEKAGAGAWGPFTCLNSLRDVEPTAKLVLEGGSIPDDGRPFIGRPK